MSKKYPNSVKPANLRWAILAVWFFAGAWQVPALAQTVAIWNGGTGNWSNTAGWNCFCVPNGFGFDANIGNAAYGNVTLNLNAQLAGLSLGNGAFGELQVVNGNTLTASNAVLVGASSTGDLSIANRGVVNDYNGALGSLSGVTGTATVGGPGSQWNNSGDLTVGVEGKGTLTINGGGQVAGGNGQIGANSGSGGTVLVSGMGSKLTTSSLCVGCSGAGTLIIDSGAVVSTGTGGAGVGWGNGGTGVATVSGAGSQWVTPGGFCVGCAATGNLTIQQGGVVKSGMQVYVGSGGHGSVTVTGAGSAWQVTDVQIGSTDPGSLTIENGGAVTATGMAIGTFAGSYGTATVSGTGSQLVTSSLCVGCSGAGTLIIDSGATVSTTGSADIGSALGGSGSVTVTGAGSAWSALASLNIGINGTGTLTAQNDGTVSAQTIDNGSLGTVDAKGGTLIGNVINDGTFDPLGTATVDGDFTLNPDGTLSLDVGGTGPGQYGVLAVSGDGTFDGTLSLDFIDGFAPIKGDAFTFIDDSTATFNFLGTDIQGLQPGFKYNTGFSNGQFTLTALDNGVSSSPTPEPGTLLLLGTALVVLVLGGLWQRRNLAACGSLE